MLASSSVLTSLQLCLRHTCAVNRPHVCRRREFKKWVWEAKTSGGVWDAEAFVRMLIFHLQTEARESQTWKFNVFRLSVLSELPLPVGYWSPFPCLLLALLCSPATARVLEQDLSSHTSTDGPTPCILIWRSEESVARWGVAFMSRFIRKKSPVRSEMLSDLRKPGGRSRPVFVFLLIHWT